MDAVASAGVLVAVGSSVVSPLVGGLDDAPRVASVVAVVEVVEVVPNSSRTNTYKAPAW